MSNLEDIVSLSFVVPVYNVARYIEKCIESMVALPDNDIEIILVDDGSTDGSSEICDKYAKTDKRIRVIHQKNQGVSVARNAGIETSRGNWICFVDGDDWIEPTLKQKLQSYLTGNYDIIFFQFDEVNAGKKGKKVSENSKSTHDITDFGFIQQATLNRFLSKYYVASPWAKLFRKSFLSENSLRYIPGIVKAQDTLFVLESYGKASTGLFVDEILYHYNVHQNSVSRRYNPNIVEIHNSLINELKRVVDLKENHSEKLNAALQVAIFRYLMVCIQVNFCHPDNPNLYRIRKNNFMEARELPAYQTAIHKADMSLCRFSERVLAILIKLNAFWIIDILFKFKAGVTRK